MQAIWQGQFDEKDVAGFEYWFNDLSAGTTLKWHRDCDEAVRKREGRYECPQVGHIYYATVDDLDGGFLEVSDKASLIEVEILGSRAHPASREPAGDLQSVVLAQGHTARARAAHRVPREPVDAQAPHLRS